MPDVFHWFGQDIAFTLQGDVQTASEEERTQQRIVRRLMTAARAYLWHPRYGAGLPGRIGNPVSLRSLRGIVMGQVLREASVARSPMPVVTITQIATGVYCRIDYTDALTGNPPQVALSFALAATALP